MRNDTLQDAKEHRVSLKCRKQLRVEELEMVNMHEALDVPSSEVTHLKLPGLSTLGGQGKSSFVRCI